MFIRFHKLPIVGRFNHVSHVSSDSLIIVISQKKKVKESEGNVIPIYEEDEANTKKKMNET